MSRLDAFGPLLALSLWSWSAHVFAPAILLKRRGLYRPATLGLPPSVAPARGGGPDLSRRFPAPVFLAEQPEDYASVEEFDQHAASYQAVVAPFSDPIYREAVQLMRPHLGPGARILDPSSGAGHAAADLSELVPDGEVVAADLSRGMVQESARRAKERGRRNMAFFQADVGSPPEAFLGYFDAVFCCLAFHHYPDGEAAAAGLRAVLAPGGKLFIADGGPAWFVALAREVSRIADPGFVRHRTGEEFIALLRGAGFADVYWEEALPGIGFTVAST